MYFSIFLTDITHEDLITPYHQSLKTLCKVSPISESNPCL